MDRMCLFLLSKAVEKWKPPTFYKVVPSFLPLLHAPCDALSLPIQVHVELDSADLF
jgi:hypothetical protein